MDNSFTSITTTYDCPSNTPQFAQDFMIACVGSGLVETLTKDDRDGSYAAARVLAFAQELFGVYSPFTPKKEQCQTCGKDT